jgi:predicted acetyltransferase
MQLIEPDPRYHASYLAALDELDAEGNGHYLTLVLEPEPGFAGVRFDRAALADPGTFADFCAYTRELAYDETPRPAAWVTGSYLWMLEGDQVVGRISFRHELTSFLLEVGGHIGYAVRPSARPSARRRGFASQAVAQLLPRCAERGLGEVLITCDEDNVGSRRTIERNGGVLEDLRNGKLRFWVPTGNPDSSAIAPRGVPAGSQTNRG